MFKVSIINCFVDVALVKLSIRLRFRNGKRKEERNVENSELSDKPRFRRLKVTAIKEPKLLPGLNHKNYSKKAINEEEKTNPFENLSKNREYKDFFQNYISFRKGPLCIFKQLYLCYLG